MFRQFLAMAILPLTLGAYSAVVYPRTASTVAEIAPKPTKVLGTVDVRTKPVNIENVPAVPDATVQKPGEYVGDDVAQVEAAADAREAARRKISWLDRVEAAVDKNWVSQMIVRGLDQESIPSDNGEWHKEYLKNIDQYESVAIDQDELDMLRGYQAQSSRKGYNATVREIEVRRERNRIIDSNGTGWAFDLFLFILDPLKLISILSIIYLIFRIKSRDKNDLIVK